MRRVPAAQRRLRGSRRRGRVFSYVAAYMLGLVCYIGNSSVAGQLRSFLRRTHDQTQVILTSPLTSFAPGRSKHQVSRRTSYPFNVASDSNRRECAHCCLGGGLGSLCGPLLVSNLVCYLKSESARKMLSAKSCRCIAIGSNI